MLIAAMVPAAVPIKPLFSLRNREGADAVSSTV
jgi:hypothetical protein